MLIEAKARDPRPGDDRQPHYQFGSEEKKSRLPVWVAIGLSGVFAYLKLFANSAEPHAAETRASGEPPSPSRHHTPHHPTSAPAHSAAVGVADHAGSQTAEPPPSTSWNETVALSVDDIISFEIAPPTNRFRYFSERPQFVVPGNDNAPHASYSPGVVQAAGHSTAAHLFIGPVQLDGIDPSASEEPPPAPQIAAGKAPTTIGERTQSLNRAPSVGGPLRLRDVVAGQAVLLAVGDLLLGAADADGDELHLSNLAASTGQLLSVGNGWAYVSDAAGEGPVTLTYDIGDGEFAVHQRADFSVILDPALPETTDGTVEEAETGTGSLTTAPNGSGPETSVTDTAANLSIEKQVGDVLVGGPGNDQIYGGAGNDVLDGRDGDDQLFGEGGDDIVIGGRGDDLIDGGPGDDTLVDGPGSDRLEGGPGFDTLDLSAVSSAVIVDLRGGTSSGAEIGDNIVADIERILGGSGNDTFIVGSAAVQIAGGEGRDLYEVGTGEGEAHYAGEPIAKGPLEVLDFAVGDRLRIADYELWDRSDTDTSPQFNGVYLAEDPANGQPIRAREDHFEDLDVTFVEADLDHDDTYEISVSLRGHHDLAIATHPIA